MKIREKTRPVQVADRQIGGQDQVLVQSMCTIKTSKVDEVVDQILDLERAGCEIIRVSVLDEEDARAIEKIKEKIHIPIVADIHFDYRLALAAIEAGVDKIRLNPGNIGSRENVEAVVKACKERKIPIRIGINSGSLEKDLVEKYGIVTPEAMIESAKRHVDILEDLDFHDIVLSFKSSDPLLCIDVYRLAAKTFDYPLHLGVTEAGTLVNSSIKSALALGTLMLEGIGDTIRISVAGDPVQEIPLCLELLKDVGLRKDVPNLIVCPSCGRTAWDMQPVIQEIEDYLKEVKKPVDVAIMGCVVNGPGEAREADIAIAGGAGKAMLLKDGHLVDTVTVEEIIPRLKELIDAYEPAQIA